ncbi:MAG TPA: tetratricopeptide repeat protein [Tepidisphaeraceae bacterium]|jgi:tetratricopeptide (TPR) repeat protein|nr:tetratricopeptide repeat protein [Tepidisphaeraceae bacterium]
MSAPPTPFLDVPTLLERSSERPRAPLVGYFVAGMLLVILLMGYFSATGSTVGESVSALLPLIVLLLVGGAAASSFSNVRRHRAEQRQLEAIEEFVQLRNWPAAGMALDGLLLAPPRSAGIRVQGLIYLASVLARYGRYEDAISVHSYLLEHVPLDPGTHYGLGVGRTMAMLHEDHLFDADRAIGELRRLGDREDSAGLALIEIYRDVKTGHPAEAIALFEQRSAMLRDKLGHRVGDAYALVARAYDQMGNDEQARLAWRRATLLAPAIELTRRYPNVAPTAAKYEPAPAPQGM